jgi:regulatory associated protein of mTOR
LVTQRLDWSSSSSASSLRDCILLAACEAHQTLPQSAEFPADLFTACLTTPIKMALRWSVRLSSLMILSSFSYHTYNYSIPHILYFYKPCRFCNRSLLHGSLDHSLIDQIPGRQNDRKTLLGELNWIFTAITDTIAWNVLPHGTSSWRNQMSFDFKTMCLAVSGL